MRTRTIFMAGAILGISSSALAGAFTANHLVVSVFGDGAAALSSAGAQVDLVEYTKAGALFGNDALLNVTRFSDSGSASSDGALNQFNSNGFVTLGRYSSAVGTASVASTTTPRTVAQLNLATGGITYQDLDTAYSGNNIRGAFSFTGNGAFFTSGTAASAANGGIRSGSFGSTTTSQSGGAVLTNTRIVNGNAFDSAGGTVVYTSSASGAFQGISRVDTVAGTTTLLTGMPTASGPSSYDFFFASANTLYVADDRATASGGGLQKWTQSGGTWSLAYTLTGGLTAGLRHLAFDGTTIFATTADATSNKLVSVVDSGASSSFGLLATAGTNQAFRGVELTAPVTTPEPASMAVLGLGVLALVRRRRSSR